MSPAKDLERVLKAPAELSQAEQRSRLLGEILDAGEEHLPSLRQLALRQDLPSVVRCAATDRYATLAGSKADSLLTELADSREPDEDVRMAAFQWFAQVEAWREQEGELRTRGERPGWRDRSSQDPSPRVRWLATL